jgi:hypothetical protein
MIDYLLRIPGHHNVWPVSFTQASNSEDSKNQRPVPLSRLLKLSAWVWKKLSGESHLIRARRVDTIDMYELEYRPGGVASSTAFSQCHLLNSMFDFRNVTGNHGNL